MVKVSVYLNRHVIVMSSLFVLVSMKSFVLSVSVIQPLSSTLRRLCFVIMAFTEYIHIYLTMLINIADIYGALVTLIEAALKYQAVFE